MKTRLSKVLAVVLSMLMLLATASIAFATGGTLAGNGTQTDPYLIADKDDLAAVAGNPGAYDGKYLALANDIDLENTLPTPIGTQEVPFKGFFDGCGYVIKNFTIKNKSNGGLFGYAVDAVIKNVTVIGGKTTGATTTNVGIVVGYAEGTTISGVKTMNCSVVGSSVIGGIAGAVTDSEISDCTAAGSVALNGGDTVGGIVGMATNSSVLRCINSATINAKTKKNGAGIAGSITGTISHCINTGKITQTSGTTGDYRIAGIAGVAGGEISYCGNAGEVECKSCSGIAGYADGLTVTYCYNAGTLKYDTLTNSFNVIAPAEATVSNCIGVDGTVTADDLKNAETFEGWDFDSVWYAPGDYHGYPYPVLRDCNFHTLTVTERTPTCTAPGVKDVHCADLCGFSYQETTADKLGHDYTVVKSKKEANCTYEGEIVYQCSRCQEENPEKTTLPVDENKHVDEDNDNVCDLCKKTIKEEEVKKSFFQKVIDFFKRIFDWIKNLFTRH